MRKLQIGHVRRARAVGALAWSDRTGAGAGHDQDRLGNFQDRTVCGRRRVTTLPNYQVWVKDVNDAGGINVGGKKMKIEVIEYDDRSNSEEMIKAVERLATQDKVDFILPPW